MILDKIKTNRAFKYEKSILVIKNVPMLKYVIMELKKEFLYNLIMFIILLLHVVLLQIMSFFSPGLYPNSCNGE